MRRLLVLLLLLAPLLFTGCATSTPPAAGSSSTRTFLGLVTVEEGAYTPPENATFAVGEGELVKNEERSGRKVSLLWGLITYTDY